MSSPLSIDLDAVTGLAAELTALATELDGDARTCRTAAAPLADALGGTEGWRAGGVATAWSTLLGLLARRTGEIGAALAAVAAAYLAADRALADRIDPVGPGTAPR